MSERIFILADSRTPDGANHVVRVLRHIHRRNESLEFYIERKERFKVVCEIVNPNNGCDLLGPSRSVVLANMITQAQTALTSFILEKTAEKYEIEDFDCGEFSR